MKLIVSIRDSKAESWSLPVCLENKAVALRQFSDLVNEGRTLLSQHPADFDIWIIGSFDDCSGQLVNSVPEHLANGIDVKVKSTAQE